MTSENEVSILMRVLKLICSSSSCGLVIWGHKWQLTFSGWIKQITKEFSFYLICTSTQSYHIDPYCPGTINALFSSQTCGRFVYPFWEKRMIAIWSSAVVSVFFLGLFFGIFSWTSPFCYHLLWVNWSSKEPLSRIVRSDWNLIKDLR